MIFFKKKYYIRRFSAPEFTRGYVSMPHVDIPVLADVQTTDDSMRTGPDGTTSIQRIKVFCDEPLLVEDTRTNQKADHIFFDNKEFECTSCRLSNNTIIRHYVATFVECLDQGENK